MRTGHWSLERYDTVARRPNANQRADNMVPSEGSERQRPQPRAKLLCNRYCGFHTVLCGASDSQPHDTAYAWHAAESFVITTSSVYSVW